MVTSGIQGHAYHPFLQQRHKETRVSPQSCSSGMHEIYSSACNTIPRTQGRAGDSIYKRCVARVRPTTTQAETGKAKT